MTCWLVSWLLPDVGDEIHILSLRVFRMRADRRRRTSRSNHGGLLQSIPIDQSLVQSPIARKPSNGRALLTTRCTRDCGHRLHGDYE
jgi:hypothetical protein